MSDFGFYFLLGWEHIMSLDALDHLLFIAALTVIYRLNDWKELLVLITAFTVGHSLTLAASLLKGALIPTSWVEFLIPCTIIITAFINLFRKDFTNKTALSSYLLALFFGLIHGLGFANTLSFILAGDQSMGWALLGFNLGVEAGQIIVVLGILIITYALLRYAKLNRRYWIMGASCLIGLFALKMAIERWP
jgi:hypothetical protein